MDKQLRLESGHQQMRHPLAVCTGRGSMGVCPSPLTSASPDHLDVVAEKMLLKAMLR